MIADVRQLLVDARETLDAAGVEYAVIGGCARNAYAEPRATKAVDFVVAADATSYNAVVEALGARGFVLASAVGAEGDPVPDLVLYRDARGRRVDILFARRRSNGRRSLADRPLRPMRPWCSPSCHPRI